jgi:hypothetical protein
MNIVTKALVSSIVCAISNYALAWDCHTDGKSHPLTITLQKMDISVQPVGERFDVKLSIKCVDDHVTIDIPVIKQRFRSSQESVNFTAPPGVTQGEFPTLYPKPPKGDQPSGTSYPCLPPGDQDPPPPTGSPCLPPDYPLGGFIDTVDNAIPAPFRPTGGLPIRFEIESKSKPGLRYRGDIDNQGRLQFAAVGNYPLDVGQFETLPASITYVIEPATTITLNNFKISLGPSNAAKWEPGRYACDGDSDEMSNGSEPPKSCDKHLSIHFDFGDYDDPQRGFINGTYYSIWADNSAALHVPQTKGFKNYALAKIKVEDFGKTHTIEKVINLTRDPNGDKLFGDYTYAEGSVAIDPTNKDNVVVAIQERKSSRVGFVLSRSSDGGETWTKKRIGLACLNSDLTKCPAPPNFPKTCYPAKPQPPVNGPPPLDPNIPTGGVDFHIGFDRFGGLWLVYLSVANPPDHQQMIYSADKGETFTPIDAMNVYPCGSDVPDSPVNARRLWQGLDYDYLAIGPDATNLEYDTVWTSVGLEFNNDTPNEAGQIVKGIRVKGLGVPNIDFPSAKTYSLPSSREAGFPSMDLDPNGAVIISLKQTNVKGTYLEQLQNNNQGWINVLENGLADDRFSAKREFALTAIGSGYGLPPRPHNTFLTTGSPMVAIDKSSQHSGRIYVVYTNRPGIYSDTTRPYLIWSDDRGLTWSNAINVSTDQTASIVILTTIAVDPVTGVVALAWGDTRGSVTNEEVNHYGVFLDPRELK